MNDDQLLRYSRHILLDEVGIEAQQRFLDAHALIVGAGGLGSPVAMYLAAAGVGRLTLVDEDAVDLTNLQRQIAHTTEAVGELKVESARATIARLNPQTRVTTVAERVDATRLDTLVRDATIVLDCTDNFVTRHAINRACVTHRVPLVSGSALRFDGQLTTFDARNSASPCYACIFPPDETFEEVACSTMGVLAPVVGIVGSMQAAEALKVIGEFGEPLVGRLLMLDALTMRWDSFDAHRDADCPVCGA